MTTSHDEQRREPHCPAQLPQCAVCCGCGDEQWEGTVTALSAPLLGKQTLSYAGAAHEMQCDQRCTAAAASGLASAGLSPPSRLQEHRRQSPLARRRKSTAPRRRAQLRRLPAAVHKMCAMCKTSSTGRRKRDIKAVKSTARKDTQRTSLLISALTYSLSAPACVA